MGLVFLQRKLKNSTTGLGRKDPNSLILMLLVGFLMPVCQTYPYFAKPDAAGSVLQNFLKLQKITLQLQSLPY